MPEELCKSCIQSKATYLSKKYNLSYQDAHQRVHNAFKRKAIREKKEAKKIKEWGKSQYKIWGDKEHSVGDWHIRIYKKHGIGKLILNKSHDRSAKV